MEKLKLFIAKGIDYAKCSRALMDLDKCRDCVVMLCGNIDGCIEVLTNNAITIGITSIYDDIYVVNLLKKREGYIGGHWKKLCSGICLGGIDSRNPMQNIEMLLSSTLSDCRYTVVLSAYPLRGTAYSYTAILNRRLSFGIDVEKLSKLFSFSNGVVYIACSTFGNGIYVEKLGDRLVHISIGLNCISAILEIEFGGDIRVEYTCSQS